MAMIFKSMAGMFLAKLTIISSYENKHFKICRNIDILYIFSSTISCFKKFLSVHPFPSKFIQYDKFINIKAEL